jgi:hypothetical protein
MKENEQIIRHFLTVDTLCMYIAMCLCKLVAGIYAREHIGEWLLCLCCDHFSCHQYKTWLLSVKEYEETVFGTQGQNTIAIGLADNMFVCHHHLAK